MISRHAMIALTLSLTLVASVAAEDSAYPISRDIPKIDDSLAFERFVTTLRSRLRSAEQFDVDVYEVLFSQRRYRGVELLVRALRLGAPELAYSCAPYGIFVNPITTAYELKNFELVHNLILIDRTLLNLPNRSFETTGTVVLTRAVESGDLDWIQKLIEAGADVNTGEAKAIKGGSVFPINLLTLSPSTEVDRILEKNGIATEYKFPSPVRSRCLDDRVRLRKAPSVSAEIIALVQKGEELNIVGCTYKIERIGERSGRWVEVVTRAHRGWMFEAFVWIDDEV